MMLVQERTELMMRDMTVKVMNMLDDSSLEDVKVSAAAAAAAAACAVGDDCMD